MPLSSALSPQAGREGKQAQEVAHGVAAKVLHFSPTAHVLAAFKHALIDRDGALYPETRGIEVAIDGLKYSGFYIVATGIGISHLIMIGPHFAPDTVTTCTSNQARAHLTAEGGPPLNCQFLLDGPRAVGECRTPGGTVYQLVAEGK